MCNEKQPEAESYFTFGPKWHLPNCTTAILALMHTVPQAAGMHSEQACTWLFMYLHG